MWEKNEKRGKIKVERQKIQIASVCHPEHSEESGKMIQRGRKRGRGIKYNQLLLKMLQLQTHNFKI